MIEEFIFEKAPFAQCHASTLVDLPGGEVLAAWFGGVREGDNSVEIWTSRRSQGRWSEPVAVTQYPEMPCWNPVLFRDPQNKVWLFFKVGPSPREWTGGYRISEDNGRTWGPVVYLAAGLLGPIKNKPVLLSNGNIIAGTSVEAGYRSDTPPDAPYRAWSCWVELSADGGKSWQKYGPIAVPEENYGVIQPTIWESSPGQLKMLMRSTRRIGYICESRSSDGGKTWTPARPTHLQHPGSGIDAVRLRDGRIVLIYNHTKQGRSPLNLAVSRDDGKTWSKPYILEDEPGEFSYPAIIQAGDGKIHITYTWKRTRIKYLVIDPQTLLS